MWDKSAALFTLFLASGCFAPINEAQEEATEETPMEPGDPPETISVSGMVQSYWTAMLGQNDPLANAIVATSGLTPARQATSDTGGLYALDGVPQAATFYMDVAVPQPLSFRVTHSETIVAGTTAMDMPLYAVSTQDVARQYTSAMGALATPAPGTAIVVVDLQMANGQPLVGIAPTAIELLDGLGEPIILDALTQGPYFIGALGDAVGLETEPTSALYFDKARAVLFDIAPGTYTLRVTYDDGGALVQNESMLLAASDGATLVQSGGDEAVAGEAPEGSFRKAVYPLLQTAAQGGDGCANCHSAAGAASFLPFDGPMADVYDALTLNGIRVDLANPELSLLLTKPLAGVPGADLHPTVYLDTLNPSYQAMLLWIQDGAPF